MFPVRVELENMTLHFPREPREIPLKFYNQKYISFSWNKRVVQMFNFHISIFALSSKSDS